MGKGILLNENFELVVLNGVTAVGDTEMQEVAVILSMNQGELKDDPILGPNLVQMMKSGAKQYDIEQRARVHLARDGKNYDAIKHKIKTTIR